MAYTGNKIQPTVKKVTNDSNEFPLDINNNLCSVTGLPQATNPNDPGNPNYIVANSGCNPVTYYNVSVSDYFRKYCGANVGNNTVYNVAANLYSSAISQDEADSAARNALLYQGQAHINNIGTCSSDSTCNLTETRAYYKSTCASNLFPAPYYLTLSANNYCGTPDFCETGANGWFTTLASTNPDLFGTCVSGDIDIIVYKTVGNPCSSLRTATNLYFKATDGKFYTDSARTVLADFHFFPTDSLVLGFKQIKAGVMQDESDTYAQCTPSTTVYYQDMGTPSDISIYGNYMLACYPLQHVVVKYNISTGSNPIGTVVAGVLNEPCKNPSMTYHLNTPMLVEWKKDGSKFAVVSAGAFKSVKIFSSGGIFFRSTNFTNSPTDTEWAYNTPGGGSSGYYTVPTSSTSLVGRMTPSSTNLNDFWIPVSICFGDRFSTGNKTEDIFIGLYNKTNANVNRYAIYAISLFDYSGGINRSSTKLVYENSGFALPSGTDLIRDFSIINTFVADSETYLYKLAIVTPYADQVSGVYNKMRNYNLETLDVSISISSSSTAEPLISETTPALYSTEAIHSQTSIVWKNNIKAEINFINNELSVVIRATSNSLWDILKKTIVYSNIGLMVGSLKALILPATLSITNVQSGVSNWLPKIAPVTELGYNANTAIIKTLTTLCTNVMIPPGQRYIGTSRLEFSFSGSVITGLVYTPGTYAAQTWISNNIFTPRTLHVNIQGSQASNLYSLYSGRQIKYANWNSSSPLSLITI